MSRSRAFHTDVSQRQLKDKASDRRNSLVEAKDKPFSELTLGEKGRYMKIYISDSCYIRFLYILVYFVYVYVYVEESMLPTVFLLLHK